MSSSVLAAKNSMYVMHRVCRTLRILHFSDIMTMLTRDGKYKNVKKKQKNDKA